MDEQASKRNRDDGSGDDERVREWEAGLPNTIDLTPLSQALISPELASAFSITAEPHRSMVEVNRESQKTLTNLRRHNSGFSSNNLKSFMEDRSLEQEENDHEKRKIQRVDSIEESDSALVTENCNDDNDQARTLKKARLVWTPQLHKRFVEVVAHLGIKNAVPKTIMQLMNVEGLTRENVASHLQKYRLYLKRMQGLTTEGPSASDQLFASTPVPPNLCEPTGGGGGYIQAPPAPAPAPAPAPPMGYGAYGAPMSGPYGHMGMPSGNQASGGYRPASGGYHGFESHHHPYNMYREQQGDWSGNRFGSVVPYSHSNHNNK